MHDRQNLTNDCGIRKKMKATCDDIIADLVQFKAFKKKNNEEQDAFKKEIENLRNSND